MDDGVWCGDDDAGLLTMVMLVGCEVLGDLGGGGGGFLGRVWWWCQVLPGAIHVTLPVIARGWHRNSRCASALVAPDDG